MIQFTKIAQAIDVVYQATDFNTTATVTMNVYNPSNALVAGSPIAMTQVATTGVYKGSFTPTLSGTYTAIILENGLQKASASTSVIYHDLDTIGTVVDSISTAPGYSSGGVIP